MRIAIFGAGKAGQHMLHEIRTNANEIEPIIFLDNKIEGKCENLGIMKPDTFFQTEQANDIDAVFIAAGAQKTLNIMINTLRAHNVSNIYMMHDIAGKNKLTLFDDGKPIASRLRKIRFDDKKPTLPYMEIPITDKCNLNCKGCLFACSEKDESEDIPADDIVSDMKRMSELFYDIPWIRILGGEPLMHPAILRILENARNIYKDSEIDLCTNGLLIPKLSDTFFEQIKKLNITVHVSGYKPTYGILDSIDERLKKFGLNYTVLRRDEFLKYYTTAPDNDMMANFRDCIASGCRELYRGRLMRCSAAIAFDKLNGQYGTDYKVVKDIDWYDIYDPKFDAMKISQELNRCSHICKYCDVENMKSFGWDYAGKDVSLSDYIL